MRKAACPLYRSKPATASEIQFDAVKNKVNVTTMGVEIAKIPDYQVCHFPENKNSYFSWQVCERNEKLSAPINTSI
jgi:hypothetical protein